MKPTDQAVLTFDVEDWFCVRNMRDAIPYESWHQQELRVGEGMTFILQELKARGIRATFFVLGWIAERMPSLVKEIAAHGHEIATHGYSHQVIDSMSPESFLQDTAKSLAVLKDITGKTVSGFRAPSFSVTKKTLWALDVLKKLGLSYDSSIYPTRHPDYGIPDFGSAPRRVAGLWELPMTSLSVGGMQIPVSGGGYFRLLPYALTRRLLRRAARQGTVVLYFHPWEFDAEQPRVALPHFRRFRHYVGLARNRAKFRRLLDDFTFSTMEDYLGRTATC